MIWTPDNVRRIILDMAGRILQNPHAGLPTVVSPELDLYRDVGLDSISRMELAGYLNEFFGIFDTSVENYLLAGTTLDHWVNCILRARSQVDDYLTFRTSGTSGAARAVRHSMASLLFEARFLMELLPRPDRVVSLVPANHIYGFIYTVLLPALWNVPLCLLADTPATAITANTLLVGTPFTWEYTYQSLLAGKSLPCRGVSSAAPMPPGLFDQLMNASVFMTEIYGSSETGGLGYRHRLDAPFTLFPHVTLLAGEPFTICRTDTGATFTVPDRLERVSETEIRVLGRLDDSVSIAGVNVYPAAIRQVISECPLVATCDIYAKADMGAHKLYGAVQLRTLNDANRNAFLHWVRQHLSPPEIPQNLYIY
ncbi:AMP-binding protein [Spirosoma fluviale]|uniref:4-coumarate--CoA ligase, photoactive yellow protein activation family n=1 Tax=Spirosoma fluviale TaxID=1597977 RepID=A0A286GC35_9BACT|nr:AMP-binding protein [Spirosoma fluviale]SOD92806.1 4-coumarate--CoA ligase, photoactive yellow protein activation family [Spirosoma fluviale]